MKLEREWVEELIFGGELSRRFTQDSPVLPDVWLSYAEQPDKQIDLLLTAYRDVSTGELSRQIEDRLTLERKHTGWKERHSNNASSPRIAYNRATVVASLYLDELVRVVLPLSAWWNLHIVKKGDQYPFEALKDLAERPDLQELFPPVPSSRAASQSEPPPRRRNAPLPSGVEPETIWMIRVIGSIMLAAKISSPSGEETRKGSNAKGDLEKRRRQWEEIQNNPKMIVEEVRRLMEGIKPVETAHPQVWSVSRNRPAMMAVSRSVAAVKADAATALFCISCNDLNWAVIDSGIDATHPAFRKRDGNGKPYELPDSRTDDWTSKTRVLATYDFTLIRKLLSADKNDLKDLPPALQRRGSRHPQIFDELRRSLQLGRQIDWSILEPFLRVPHTHHEYDVPSHDHGTHVAGILGGDWRKDDTPASDAGTLRGVCPDINIYDLRVLDDNGMGDEFSVMAALQFIRHLNAHQDYVVVHGANLSLSIHHDVANYACGRTPICEECERLVSAGVVVVAAAGNQGYLQYMTAKGVEEGYRSISITDPGNAEQVITVGATHRYLPHTYGVSYFSSRGPTGDGRIKPDLVAPGEKIEAPTPGAQSRRMDGTSMAAPHVSGGAALLMARHRELIGEPARVKRILCSTATDLGRERYFQGAGMVDVLRALQAV